MIKTKIGITWIIIGIIFSFIPFFGGIGTLFLLIGIIYLYNGRNEFDIKHTKNIKYGLIVFSVGFIILLISLLLNFRSFMISSIENKSETLSYLNLSIYLLIVGTTLFFLAFYFFVNYFSKSHVKKLFLFGIIIFLIGSILINIVPINYQREKNFTNNNINKIEEVMEFERTIQDQYYQRIYYQVPLNIMCSIIFIFGYWMAYKEVKKYKIFSDEKKIYIAKERKKDKFPKVFNYYCPKCLFQTNKKLNKCPKCRESRLIKTG